MKKCFETNLIFGQIAENWVEHKVKQSDFVVEKNCRKPTYEGHGPAAEINGAKQIALVDYAVSKRGVWIPIEVKAKNRWTVGALTGEEETGIDYDKLVDYRDLQHATGARVMLLFVGYLGQAEWLASNPRALAQYEKSGSTTYRYPPDVIYGQWLPNLKPSLPFPTVCDGKQMVYFGLRQFTPNWLQMLDDEVDLRAKYLF